MAAYPERRFAGGVMPENRDGRRSSLCTLPDKADDEQAELPGGNVTGGKSQDGAWVSRLSGSS